MGRLARFIRFYTDEDEGNKPEPYELETVTGVSPLLLESAVAKAIKSLTQTGKCVQSGTPTPSSPVDIYCNNGKLGMVDDELPSGFTRLQSIHFDRNSYLDSLIVPNTYDYEIETKCSFDRASSTPICAWGFMGSQSSTPRWVLAGYVQSSTDCYILNANATVPFTPFDTDAHVFKGVIGTENNTPFWAAYLDGARKSVANLTLTERWEANTLSIYIGARNNTGTAGNFFEGDFYYHKVFKAGVLIQHLVAARRDADSVLGMYDLVSGTFHTNEGTGAFTAGAVDYSHAHIGVIGTAEVLTVGGKNLFNATIEQGNIASTTGQNTTSQTRCRSADYIPVRPNTTYTLSCAIDGYAGAASAGMFIYQYNSDASTWQTSGWKTNISGYTFTTDSTTVKIRVVFAKAGSGVNIVPSDVSKVQLELGSSASDYEPYVQPQTVTDIPMLLSVGDYADEYEFIGGPLTHKVGIKVLDGTETDAWTVQSNRVYATKTSLGMSNAMNNTKIMCEISDQSLNGINTYGNVLIYGDWAGAGIDTPEKLNAYLAAHPVIIVYVLDEATTESVEPQPLHTTEGDNTISVTAEVSGIALEAVYAKKAS